MNQVWILNSINNLVFKPVNYYSTLKAQRKIKSLSSPLFDQKDAKCRYKYLVLWRDKPYLSFNTLILTIIYSEDILTKIYSDDDICGMLACLIDKVFVMYGGRVFQQTVPISMGNNFRPFIADLFPYSYEADFIQCLLQRRGKSWLNLLISPCDI